MGDLHGSECFPDTMPDNIPIPQSPTAKLDYVSNESSNTFDRNPSLTGDHKKQDKTVTTVSTLLDPNDLRSLSLSPFSHDGRRTPVSIRSFSPGPVPRNEDRGLWCSLKSIWQKNRAPLLVFLSQMFGAIMNLAARLLELEDGGMHPMQVLFTRMILTVVACGFYMWRKGIPDGPLGPKNVRWLLVARGLTGFFGIYGMWYSVMYLPLAEATVISFLAPNLAGYLCHMFIHDPFTRTEQLASFVALGGVVLITRPVSLFSGAAVDAASASASAAGAGARAVTTAFNATAVAQSTRPSLEHVATSAERLTAIGVALLGVLGSAGAILSLRWIGPRAHPLHAVNYFSAWCAIVSATALGLAPLADYDQPYLRFEPPHSLRQWGLLLCIGVSGFATQFLLTAGLSGESSNRATAMLYTNMLFAAGFDRWIFGHRMGWMSLAGCGFILGSAMWVALMKKEGGPISIDGGLDVEGGTREENETGMEGVPILRNIDVDVDVEEDEHGRR
ncbi:hypothetical protein SLS62_000527 [Diatrype stigma]|uniref:EamA domain-containing protein n=1 Tax=Diatrype stigma TaxID=117547 RepID=A0AAN9V1U4_9PEZI